MTQPFPELPLPPRPAQRRVDRTVHGITTTDPYAWLIDPDDPETVPHLRLQNEYTEEVTANQAGTRETIFDEIRRRTLETDLSVAVRDGDWWYLTRTAEGKNHPIQCRIPDDGTHRAWDDDPANEQVLLDLNELVVDDGYLGLGVLDVSPDGNWLAYALDRAGDERHELRFRDLRTGLESAETLADVSYGFAWAADSATCWYVLQDEASRPDRVLRHKVGADPVHDVLVYQEADEHFHVQVGASRSAALAVISIGSAVTSELWLLDTHQPATEPALVTARDHGIEYSVAHHRSGLYITSNRAGADDFAVWRAVLDGTQVADSASWTSVVPAAPGTRFTGVETFASHAVVHGRTDGSTALWLLDHETLELTRVETDEEVATLTPGANPSYVTDTYRFGYQSLTTPPSVIDLDVATGERTVRKQQPVLDGFDTADYASERVWATADDGTMVPISVVWRPDRTTDQPGPCVLYGYGAYEISMDPWFSIARLSLLDRGVAFAIAHVRGGGEMGRRWYTDGKFGAKANTFTDVVACARHLCQTGRTDPSQLAIRGGSAGGLLVGASVNLAPEMFRAAVAEAGFVDPLNTMLDPSLPLTVIEWDEWGDPLHDPEAYGWLASYSPYENIADGEHATYPAILATAGLTDPRVGYHEPTKWVARLRDLGHGYDALDSRSATAPVLLKVDMGAGHGGPSGRYDSWRDEAFILAFLLSELGVTAEPA